ncbi:hypothetical protein ALC62_01253 [Cyphomyrmex costatus]|uniref:HAT C-terminal dimerisation domain-containing protein n=1 Tax=Cyphomyrmex costatus TaxID=456900 RepID=A0A195D4D7_9HYME|nr:hypothetical protein ALC62_01253 [Cyphomyrmex costatus]
MNSTYNKNNTEKNLSSSNDESNAHTNRRKSSSAEISESNKHVNVKINKTFKVRFSDRRKEAEIRYVALLIDQNIPCKHSTEILKLFEHVGEGPNVIKKMRMGKKKCTQIITNILYPIEIKRFINKIKNTKFTVFICTKSDTYEDNNKVIALQVRYVDSETLDVRSQLVDLMSIDAKNFCENKLFETLQNKMLELNIPLSNIVALLCNTESVVTGNHSFREKFKKLCHPHLMTFLCSCHSTALITYNACDKLPRFCENLVNSVCTYIIKHPEYSDLKELYEYFQEINNKMLKYDIYWLSHYICVEKFVKYWNAIQIFLQTTVRTRSANNVLFIMSIIEIKAYFLFLKYVLNFFNAFNIFFETLETRIYLLQSKSLILLQQICQNFLKTEHLTSSLLDIDFSLEENHKILNEICLGSECEEYLNELVRQEHENVVVTVRQNCLMFYVTAANEICEKLPVEDIFLSKLQVFKNLFETDIETSFSDVSFIVKTIGGFDEDALKKEWTALSLEFTIEEKRRLTSLSFDNMWKEILQRRYPNNIAKYPHLTNVLNAIRSFPNSDADMEKTFSSNIEYVLRNHCRTAPATINAMCVFKSALTARGETSLSMTIEKEHLSLMTTDRLYPYLRKE